MEDNEREEGGISLGYIFHIIFTQKWLALIILVAVTLAGTLGIYFGKNTLDEKYDISFTLELPQTEIKEATVKDDKNIKSYATVVYYPDGTPFYYTDIVSLNTLQKVKNSNAAFKDIDVEKMSKKGDISISRSVYETATNSGTYESLYSLSVKSRYFADNDVARDFVVALINTPIDYLSLMDIDYDVYIDSAKIAPDYVNEISQLMNQLSYIIGRYDTFIGIYNDLSVDGKTLRSYSQAVRTYLNDIAELDILRAEVRKECYLKSEALINRYEIELEKLQRQYTIAKYTLDNLTEKGDSESISAEVFKTQSDLVKELETEIKEITGYTTENDEKIVGFLNSTDYGDNKSSGHRAFLVNLNKAYNQVQAYTDEFKNVASKLYSKVAVVSYSDSNVIVANGVTSIVSALLISFVIGLVLAMIIAFIVGWVKNNKNKKVAAAAQAANATQVAQTSENHIEAQSVNTQSVETQSEQENQ